jgi:hypothetical protein
MKPLTSDARTGILLFFLLLLVLAWLHRKELLPLLLRYL